MQHLLTHNQTLHPIRNTSGLLVNLLVRDELLCFEMRLTCSWFQVPSKSCTWGNADFTRTRVLQQLCSSVSNCCCITTNTHTHTRQRGSKAPPVVKHGHAPPPLTGSSTTWPPCSAASFTSRRARLRLSALTADTCSWTTARRNSGGARGEQHC